MSDKSSICVLVSGGLDSDVLLSELAQTYRKVWPIYIRQGLAWENVELYGLRRYLKSITLTPIPSPLSMERGKKQYKNRTLSLLKGEGGQRPGEGVQPLVILSLPMRDLYGRHWSTGTGAVPGRRSRDSAVYLPGRNLVLTVKAAVYCALNKIPVLAIGSLGHNPFPDADPVFFRRWGAAVGAGLGMSFKVIAPYRHLSKAQVIARGRNLPLELSFSCIAPQKKIHCGHCNKCVERRRAFRAAGIEDKTRYA